MNLRIGENSIRLRKAKDITQEQLAADKLAKSIYFDPSIAYEEKVRRIESYGDRRLDIYKETDEAFFLIFASSIMGRLANDLTYRNGSKEDAERIKAKTADIRP